MEISHLLWDTFQPTFQMTKTRDCNVAGAGGVVLDRGFSGK